MSLPPTAAEIIEADVVIVGSGVAGLSVALRLAAEHRVGSIAVVTKSGFGDGCSRWAQGGIACALDRGDSPSRHRFDTLAVSAGLGEPRMAHILTREAAAAIARLIGRGARFDRGADGTLELGLEGGHGHRRILHADGDATGAEIMRALTEAARACPGLRIYEHTRGTELLVRDGRVAGLRARTAAAGEIVFSSGAVVFATGGFGHAYLKTTNPPEATGDALAMAARAGAELVDMELVQFHPTALDAPGAHPLPLLTEALRGAGALLIDGRGRRFMPALSPRAELAPRDLVARAIWERLAAGDGVFLDCRPALRRRSFPTAVDSCRRHGLDPATEPVPVSPAAHYTMGGIAVDDCGQSSLAGLWACGEAAGSGLHGANRLASNSLLEGLVFGARLADDVGQGLEKGGERLGLSLSFVPGGEAPDPAPDAVSDAASDSRLRQRIRALLWERVGVVRTAHGLQAALRELARLEAACPAGGQTADLVVIGRLAATAALARRESRGAHFRRDFPEPSEAYRCHLRLGLSRSGDAAGGPAPPQDGRAELHYGPLGTAPVGSTAGGVAAASRRVRG